jgi:hypothetical protein
MIGVHQPAKLLSFVEAQLIEIGRKIRQICEYSLRF